MDRARGQNNTIIIFKKRWRGGRDLILIMRRTIKELIGPRGPRGVQRTGGRRRRLILYGINSGFFCLQNSTGVRVGITISVSLEEKCPAGHVAAPVEHTGVGFLLVPT